MQFSNPGSLPSVITVGGGTINTVTGSVGSVQGSNIGARVPYLGVDNLYWPQINGQSFPPTLGNGAYGNHTGFASINGTSSTGGTDGSATYPTINRGNTLTLQGTWWMTGGNVSRENKVYKICSLGGGGGGTSPYALVAVVSANFTPFTLTYQIRNGATVVTTLGTDNFGSFSNTTTPVLSWELVLNADGSVSATVNGHTGTAPAGSVPTTVGITLIQDLAGDAFNQGGVGPLSGNYS